MSANPNPPPWPKTMPRLPQQVFFLPDFIDKKYKKNFGVGRLTPTLHLSSQGEAEFFFLVVNSDFVDILLQN